MNQRFSGNFNRNFFPPLFEQQAALLICSFLEMEVPPQRPQPQIFCLPYRFLSSNHLHNANKRYPRSIPVVWERVTEVRLLGPDCSQTLWLGSVSFHLTPCQHEVTEQTPLPSPPPLTCSRSRSYSHSPLVQWAWDAKYELG